MQGNVEHAPAESSRITIQPVGLNDNEMRMLKSLCTISSISRGSRTRRYVLAEHDNVGDIHLVCARKPDVYARWRNTYSIDEIPTILIAQGGISAQGNVKVAQYPLIPSRLLALLDSLPVRPASWRGRDEKAILAGEPLKGNIPLVGDREIVALVADDSSTARKQIELGLRELGIKAHCVDDGWQALQVLQTSVFGMIFLDVMMPGADGYEVCRSVKKNKVTRNLPVIMLTGKSSPFDRVRGSLAGCDSYLTKPVEMKTFLTTVRKHLEQINSAASAAPNEKTTFTA